MFGILKKRIKESVKQLAGIAREKDEEDAKREAAAPPAAKEAKPKPARKEIITKKEGIARKAEEMPEAPHEQEEQKRRLPRFGLVKKIREKEFTGREIDDLFASMEPGLLQANIALEVLDFFRSRLKEMLVGKPVKRKDAEQVIIGSFRRLLLETVSQGKIEIGDVIRAAKKDKRPACLLFLGYNGSGKTTTIAKVAKKLLSEKRKPVLAAGDTFRAASIEQLQFHADKLGINVIKHKYGADPAAVVFDARKHAESRGLDAVLADTAGRMHTNVNLMDELKKVVRVNKPDLKILVVDSLTGNDVVHQVSKFDEGVGIDCMILTKMDVNEKGGSIISACFTAKKPVLFLGTGQGYDDLQEFDPERFVEQILE
ncbi:MAG: signal recognition particle-docking protein FtsY [Candidatus Aenigmarchaeota archaeon]|nr:signal recognition particle-docking protein FtsY [Candidatus Aenigmarchaeota archaeon]